jgi:putative transposase
MPRRALIRSQTLPYHVVNQCDNREPFPAARQEVWSQFCSALWEATVLMSAQIHAFVLMPNHYHLIVSAPEQDIGEIMRWVGRSVTEKHNRTAGRCGHLFRGRYKWSLIDHDLYLSHAYKYVYRNPVRAGLCSRVEDWPYSSLQFKIGITTPLLRLSPPRSQWILPEATDQLEWLNHAPGIQTEVQIQSALRRHRFEYSKERDTRSLPSWAGKPI